MRECVCVYERERSFVLKQSKAGEGERETDDDAPLWNLKMKYSLNIVLNL